MAGRLTDQDDSFACTRRTYDYRDLALTVIEGLTSGSPCNGSCLRTLTNTYDSLGRLTKSQVTAGQGQNDIPAQSTYDAAGNALTSPSVVGSVTRSVDYTFNPLDEVVFERACARNRPEKIFWCSADPPSRRLA